MTTSYFTALGGELIEPRAIARIPFHGGAWPAVVDHVHPRGTVTVRPMSRDGMAWDTPRKVSADDVWFLIEPSEARALELPKVAA